MQLLVLAGAGLGFAVVGCEQKANPVTDAAKAVGGAAKDATKAVGDTAAKATDAVKDAGAKVADGAAKATDAVKDAGAKGMDAAKDAAKGATDAVKDAGKGVAEKMMAEGQTWLKDTVTKQWPGMKDQLTSAEKAVAGLKDAAIKGKAEGLVKDLKAQIPGMEKLVGELGAEKDLTKFGTMFTEAKKMWDGFGGKMKELTALLPK